MSAKGGVCKRQRQKAWEFAERRCAFIVDPKKRKYEEDKLFASEFERLKTLHDKNVENRSAGLGRKNAKSKYAGVLGSYSGVTCTFNKIQTYA